MRRLEFVSLQVRDLDVSKAFYTQLLRFEIGNVNNPDAVVFHYNKGEASFAIRKPIGNLDGKELGNGVSLWFAIEESIETFRSQLLSKGVQMVGDIASTPFGKTVMVKDPDGYMLTFLELVKP